MYTIKFQYCSNEDPIIHKYDGELGEHTYAKVTSIMEGEEIWHRSFMVHKPEEFTKWRDENFDYTANVDLHVVSNDPAEAFNEDKMSQNIYFELLTFYDREKRFHKCLVFCADCFIMNDAGQTVDNFNA